MRVSYFILAVYVFLQAGAGLTWFTVDPKLVGIVGMAFVVAVIIEAIIGVRAIIEKKV